MFTRPSDLSDDAVATALWEGWMIQVDEITYAPLGFGSHHWQAVAGSARWFVTVDDLEFCRLDGDDTRSAVHDRLVAALSTAQSLRTGGYDFVVAPVSSESRQIVEAIDDRYVLAVYPYVEGATGSFGRFDNRTDRLDVVDRLLEIHSAGSRVLARTDDLSIPWRDGLIAAIREISDDWSSGPFGEPTRELLQRHAGPLQDVLVAYDQLVAVVRSRDEPVVITHGEPHSGNVIMTPEGPMLIDWDTTLLAPPERDLWNLIDEDPEVRDHYEQCSGQTLDDSALRMFRLWWDLGEVALFVQDFRRTHRDTTDTRTAWRGLQRHLDPDRWVDLI